MVWAGTPAGVIVDGGGEFHREFAKEVEDMSADARVTAARSPTQNAHAERAGGAWKLHAKALSDEFSLNFGNAQDLFWCCTTVELGGEQRRQRHGLQRGTLGAWARHEVALRHAVFGRATLAAVSARVGQLLRTSR